MRYLSVLVISLGLIYVNGVPTQINRAGSVPVQGLQRRSTFQGVLPGKLGGKTTPRTKSFEDLISNQKRKAEEMKKLKLSGNDCFPKEDESYYQPQGKAGGFLATIIASVKIKNPVKDNLPTWKNVRFLRDIQLLVDYKDKTGFFHQSQFLLSDFDASKPAVMNRIHLDNIDPTRPFALIYHGWLDGCVVSNYYIEEQGWMNKTARALVDKYRMNVIKVDWSKLSSYSYFAASEENLMFAGEFVYTGLIQLARALKPTVTDIELKSQLKRLKSFGHSLGGHLAGYVAHLIMERHGVKVALIVAMDPAGYLYFPGDIQRPCLQPDHAQKVIVFHTSLDGVVGLPIHVQLGNSFMLGDEDYYLNGGKLLHKTLDPYVTNVMSHLRVMNTVLALIRGHVLDAFYHKHNHNNKPGTELMTQKLDLGKQLEQESFPNLVPSVTPFYVKIEVDITKKKLFGKPLDGHYPVPFPQIEESSYIVNNKEVKTYKVEDFSSKKPVPVKVKAPKARKGTKAGGRLKNLLRPGDIGGAAVVSVRA